MSDHISMRDIGSASAVPGSRIALLGVDQICNFEIKGQIGFVILRIACIA